MTAIREIHCKPFDDQRPGTAGLRKKVSVFRQQHYLECFVQAIFDTLALPAGARLVVGGDGRYYNRVAINTLIAMAAAHDVGELIIGQHGILTTPAASHLIRHSQAAAGILLTASHNPGGPDGDFGIKFNMANGGQAPEHLTEAVYERSKVLTGYRIADIPPVELDKQGTQTVNGMRVSVVDCVADYADLMQSLFDFDAIRAMLADGTRIYFDAMHAATGPYAQHILCDMLGAPSDSIANATPLEDFGGLHPDPNPAEAPHLVTLAHSAEAPDLIAASDGDGDRNMILGRGLLVSPGDSLAIITANVTTAPGYRDGIPGVARSMPTSRAVDRVAAARDIPCYETPTGWRFFSNLLDAGRIGLCGEESFGTSSAHAGEKDGLWAVLFWLNMMAILRKPVADIVHEHWRTFGRTFFQRRDYFIADASKARELLDELSQATARLAGTTIAGSVIASADVFCYTDPVDNSVSNNQGIRVFLEDGGRIVYRLSGTGTSGATLRVYLDKTSTEPADLGRDNNDALQTMADAAAEIARIEAITGVTEPAAII